MKGGSGVELEHCRELALQPGSVLEFTSRFLTARQFDSALALYALTQSISSVPRTATDDSVKWSKLKWWSEELAAEPGSSSRHPVLRALWLTGSREKLDDALLQRLVSIAATQIDEPPCADEHALFERLVASNSTEILLELALDNAEIDNKNLDNLGAGSGLYNMVEGLMVNIALEVERIPLNILAKHNINPAQLQQVPRPAELSGIVAWLAELGLEWFSEGMSQLKISTGAGACRNLQLRWAVERRILARIKKDADSFLAKGARLGPVDAWFAWRFIRSLG